MTYIEYALHDIDNTEDELKRNIESAITLGVDSISVPFALTKFCKNLVKDTKIVISNPIDYPLGLLDTKSRSNAILNAINNGADKIDVVIQNHYLSHKKYDKIRSDMINNYAVCSGSNIALCYFLEYRVFTHQALIKACNILLEAPIQNVYVSTGFLLDAVEDNIIATVLLSQKTKMKTIFNGNIWTKKHVELLKKNNIDMIRLNTINGIRTYKDNI